MASENDIGALHYETDDTPTPASIGALHYAPAAEEEAGMPMLQTGSLVSGPLIEGRLVA